MRKRRTEPQLTVNGFKPLSDYDEVPIGTKLFRENDQEEVHWEYTTFILKGIINNRLIATDTNGKVVDITESFYSLYVMYK